MTAILCSDQAERELLALLADRHRAAEAVLESLRTLSTDLRQARAVEAALTQRRARMAADLAATGVPLRRIAEAMGVGTSSAHNAVRQGAKLRAA